MVFICESFFENRAFDSLDFFIQQWLAMSVCIITALNSSLLDRKNSVVSSNSVDASFC